jgi:flagellar hook-basal body complex protein FliE
MLTSISPIAALQASLATQAATPASRHMQAPVPPGQEHATGSFATELNQAIQRVGQSVAVSEDLSQRMMRGEDVELHTVALRTQEAQLQFDLLMQVRNRLIQGYQEIMRLQV